MKPEGESAENLYLNSSIDEASFILGSEFGLIVARLESDPRSWEEPIHVENVDRITKWAWRLRRTLSTETRNDGWIGLRVNAMRY